MNVTEHYLEVYSHEIRPTHTNNMRNLYMCMDIQAQEVETKGGIMNIYYCPFCGADLSKKGNNEHLSDFRGA